MAATISVAVLVRDGRKGLRECLESVQSIADEYCIVDMSASPETMSVAREFSARTRVFIWCEDDAAARNECLRLCTKDWVFFLEGCEAVEADQAKRIRWLARGPSDSCYPFEVRTYTNSPEAPDFVRCNGNDKQCAGFEGWYGASEVRLFPNNADARYEGALDATITGSLQRLGVTERTSDLAVHRYPVRFELRGNGSGVHPVRDPEASAQALAEGQRLVVAKAYDQAVRTLRQALACDPSNVEASLALGMTYHRLGRIDDARRYLRQALDLDPSQTRGWQTLAAVFSDSKDWEAAAACVERAMALDASWTEGHQRMSVALEGLGRMEEAAEEARRAFEQRSSSSEALRLYVHQMLRIEKRAAAREVIQAAIDRSGGTPDLHNTLGELCFYDKAYEEAKRHFASAGELGSAAAYNNLGVVHFHLKAYDDAKAAFERCLELDPEHRGAQRNLEKVLAHLGKA